MLSVLAEGGGRVLRISRSYDIDTNYTNSNNYSNNNSNNNNDNLQLKNQGKNDENNNNNEIIKSFGLSFSLASFGLSLVVEKPIRREFFSLYVDGLEGRVKTKGSIRSFEFMIMDLQVRFYSIII